MTKKSKASKKSKVTTNQRVKNVGHIVFSKRALQSVTKCLTKQKKALSGKRNSTPFSVGGLLWLFSRLAFWNPADKLLLSMDPTDWRTERDPKNEETNSALWEWWGRFCLELDSCSSTSCSHPPFPPPPPPHSHCTCSQATCSFNWLTWLSMHRSKKEATAASGSTLLQTVWLISSGLFTTVSLCQLQANLTGPLLYELHSHTAALANRISIGQWMEREIKLDKKRGEAVILRPIRPAQNHLVGR